MIILGIDPGTTRIGYGLIQKGRSLSFIDAGLLCITTKKQNGRLLQIHYELESVIRKFSPDLAAVETIFFSKNKKTAIDVAHARGVIVLTLAKMGVPIVEYTPPQVKQAVAGHGSADKKGIVQALEKILRIRFEDEPDDVSDAIAIALAAGIGSQILPTGASTKNNLT